MKYILRNPLEDYKRCTCTHVSCPTCYKMAESCADSDLEPPFAAEIGKDLFRRMISEELSKECRLKGSQTTSSPTTCHDDTKGDAGVLLSLPTSEETGVAEAFLRLPENQPESV